MIRLLLPALRAYVPNGIRHLSTAAAGAAVTHGLIAADQHAVLAGSILYILSSLWSWAEKRDLLGKALAA